MAAYNKCVLISVEEWNILYNNKFNIVAPDKKDLNKSKRINQTISIKI